MLLRRSRAAALPGVVACVLIGATPGAGAAAATSVRAHDSLTRHETLRGAISFATPPGWHVTPASGVYTARFTIDEGQRCTIAVLASIRGKATRRSALAQARAAIGEDPIAAGERAGGVYRLGTPFVGYPSTLYGIAVVRVTPRRFGQLRIFGSPTGNGCTADAAPNGTVASALKDVLRHASSHLRVSHQAP